MNSWSRAEVTTLLEVAAEHEPAFHPLLTFLLSTGARRGEALALKWADVDFHASRIQIRRSLVRGRFAPPTSGKARFVVLSDNLSALLRQLLRERRKQGLAAGWKELPELVFCSRTGGPLDERTWVAVGKDCDGERSVTACGPSASMMPGTRLRALRWLLVRTSPGSQPNSATRTPELPCEFTHTWSPMSPRTWGSSTSAALNGNQTAPIDESLPRQKHPRV
jgi:integrase